MTPPRSSDTERFAREYIRGLSFAPLDELIREFDRRGERIAELEANQRDLLQLCESFDQTGDQVRTHEIRETLNRGKS